LEFRRVLFRSLRTAVLLACGLSLGMGSWATAADRASPAPDEIIFPRSSAAAAEAGAAGAESADATSARSSAFAPGPTPSTDGLMSTIGYLATFACLLGGAWLLLKRGTLKRAFSESEGRLQVLETKMLGNRQFLVVVEYDDAKLLLGVCPGRIDYLTPLAGHPLSTGASEVTVPEADD